MFVKEIRCDCCNKILHKFYDKIIHGKFKEKEYFYDSQGGCFTTKKYDFCEDCWNRILREIKEKR